MPAELMQRGSSGAGGSLEGCSPRLSIVVGSPEQTEEGGLATHLKYPILTIRGGQQKVTFAGVIRRWGCQPGVTFEGVIRRWRVPTRGDL
jgi:hypothetical protein